MSVIFAGASAAKRSCWCRRGSHGIDLSRGLVQHRSSSLAVATDPALAPASLQQSLLQEPLVRFTVHDPRHEVATCSCRCAAGAVAAAAAATGCWDKRELLLEDCLDGHV